MCELRDYAPIITWLLVIAGWLIINHQHNYREKRKEIREAIKEVNSMIFNCTEEAIKYHTSSYCPLEAKKIKSHIQSIEDVILGLGEKDWGTQQVMLPMKQFRKSITLVNFDAPNTHEPRDKESELLDEILEKSNALTQRLDARFYELYH